MRLIGDLPIYVADDGADHAGWPELFTRGEVAGAPPYALSANGQRWGNPLYDWPVNRATGFRWWQERFRRTFDLFDLCRIDHFRGFVSYWAIPARNSTAKAGLQGMARTLAIELDLFLSYGSNPPLYPKWQAYFREHQPPVLFVWGQNDGIFPAAGAEPYKRDLKALEFHLLDAGHFALESDGDLIARL